MWLLLLIQICMAGVPEPIQLTPAEQKLIGSGELVIREGASGSITAILDVQASNQIVLEEVMNLQARVDEVPSIQDLSIYLRQPNTIGGKWTVGMFGVQAQFHVLYTFDYANGWITFRMDDERVNELNAADGSYQTYPVNGGTRLIYRCAASPESAVPGWVRDMITGRSMNQQLTGIESRARKRKNPGQ
ncbi:MAG: hypothetical protein CL930_01355 [Deltaproteobacteria bacterium]|nr:hypothetical protein [Deltaproteobacteria bacterium]|tara:strand:+ start:778 stop:1344 length:567 start_codon:yes stop_codon:yes gene_type:complete